MVLVYGPNDESTFGLESSPVFSCIHFLAALARRCSFMRCILLRTILRQYEPSSLGWMTVTSLEPNEDGSYWRKIVRNKMHRMKEQRRIKAAKEFAKNMLQMPDDKIPESVVA